MKSANALDEQVLRSLLVDSVTLELSDRGMQVIPGRGFPRSVAEAVAQSSAGDADFALVGTYALLERQVLLDLQWIDAGEEGSLPRPRVGDRSTFPLTPSSLMRCGRYSPGSRRAWRASRPPARRVPRRIPRPP